MRSNAASTRASKAAKVSPPAKAAPATAAVSNTRTSAAWRRSGATSRRRPAFISRNPGSSSIAIWRPPRIAAAVSCARGTPDETARSNGTAASASAIAATCALPRSVRTTWRGSTGSPAAVK